MTAYRMAGEENLRFVVRSGTQDSARIVDIEHFRQVWDKEIKEYVGGRFHQDGKGAHNWANALQFAEWSKMYQLEPTEDMIGVESKKSYILELNHLPKDGHKQNRSISAFFFELVDGNFEITIGHTLRYLSTNSQGGVEWKDSTSRMVSSGVYNVNTARIMWKKLVEDFGFERKQ